METVRARTLSSKDATLLPPLESLSEALADAEACALKDGTGVPNVAARGAGWCCA